MSAIFNNGFFLLISIITIGLLLGKIKIKGISLDLSAVIFVALILGHFNFQVPHDFQSLGLILFIFTVGIQAGPGFFSVFQKYGRQMLIISFLVIFTGALVTVILAKIFNMDSNMAVGIFTGALTSTPGLAAAIDTTQSPLASIGYGCAYPFGVVGVILFVKLTPRILKINLNREEKKLHQDDLNEHPELLDKNFKVENDNIDGKTIGTLRILSMTGANISRVLHQNIASTANADTLLHKGDVVKAVGTQKSLENVEYLIGSPTDQKIEFQGKYIVQWVLVTNKKNVNKTIGQLNLMKMYNATVTRIRRSGIDITPTAGSKIRFGDKLMIACSEQNLNEVMKLLGNDDKKLSETDLISIFLGISLGLWLGQLKIPWGSFQFGLGITGGVLLTAIILSSIGKTGPILWSMSGSANQLLRKFGLLLFLSSVGTQAGKHLTATISQYGYKIFLMGIVVTLIPMLAGLIGGRIIFKINFLSFLGVITGAMTSTPGLGSVSSLTESNIPYVSYASVYPFALIMVIIFTNIISRI